MVEICWNMLKWWPQISACALDSLYFTVRITIWPYLAMRHCWGQGLAGHKLATGSRTPWFLEFPGAFLIFLGLPWKGRRVSRQTSKIFHEKLAILLRCNWITRMQWTQSAALAWISEYQKKKRRAIDNYIVFWFFILLYPKKLDALIMRSSQMPNSSRNLSARVTVRRGCGFLDNEWTLTS